MWAAAETIIGWLVVLNSVLPAVAVLRRRKLRKLVMYQLVASMSLGETLTGAVSVVLGTLMMFELPIASWFCVVTIHLRSSVAASTVVCFFCLSLERFITVIHGLRYYDILTDGRRRLLVAASWILAAVYFTFGLVLRFMQGFGPSEKMCSHWTAVTFEFRFSGALFCTIAYLVNLGINLVVGLVGMRQGKRIRQQQFGVNVSMCQLLMQHKGYMAIAALSLLCCIFIFPNTVMNMLQSLGVTNLELLHKITTALRLVSMITDGWCLALLCPKLRNEYKKMFCCFKNRDASLKPGAVMVQVITLPDAQPEHVPGDTGDWRPTALSGSWPVDNTVTLSAIIPGIHKQSTRVTSRDRHVTPAPRETKRREPDIARVHSSPDTLVPVRPPSPTVPILLTIPPPTPARPRSQDCFTWSRHVDLQVRR